MRKSVYLSGTANNGHSGIGTCLELEEALSRLDYEISNSPNSDFLINLNHNSRSYRNFLTMGGSSEKSFLVLLEPRSVYPSQYKPNNLAKYKSVISPGNPKFNMKNGDFIGWPYKFNINPSKPGNDEEPLIGYISKQLTEGTHSYESWADRKINCSMIAANKVSPNKVNQYGLRRFFAKNMSPEDLEVFGPLWNTPIFGKIVNRIITFVAAFKSGYIPHLSSCFGNVFWNYRSAHGEVDNKHDILLDSKFSLVIENSQDYVSEKLFDAIINGSIPIYFGPDLSSVGLPPNLAIITNPQIESIKEIIHEMNPEKVKIMLDEMKIFLASERFQNSWNLESVYWKIATEFHKSVGDL
jgi:hypothetical protein